MTMSTKSTSRKGDWKDGRKVLKGGRVLGPLVALLLSTVLYFSVFPKLWGNGNASTQTGIRQQLDNLKENGKEGFGLSVFLHPEDHRNRRAETIAVEWNITKGERRPDGVLKQVYLINGQFPGPTVELHSGDTLVVAVHNLLEVNEGVAIHWHGLHVSNDMDGVPGLTQCSIPRGGSFVYQLRIDVDQAGTFWYHSHSDAQRADGLYGPIVVHRPALQGQSEAEMSHYDDDQVLMVGDLYHRSAKEVIDDYMDWKSFEIEPAPDSMLINGKGCFHCSMAVPAWPVDCEPVSVPGLYLPMRRTRLRIINTGALTGFSISVTGYAIKVIMVDGGNHVGSNAGAGTVGILYPGERIDVVVERLGETEDGSKVVVSLDHENMRFPNLALTPTQAFPIRLAQDDGVDNAHSAGKHQETLDLRVLAGSEITSTDMPRIADKTFVLYSTISYLAINENRPRGYINHTSWTLGVSNGLPFLALDRPNWRFDPKFLIPLSGGGQWIDVVLNNLDDKGHPFHLHGNDFYVLASHSPSRVGAYELYNPFDRSKGPAGGPLNLRNPLVKDTIYVPSMGE